MHEKRCMPWVKFHWGHAKQDGTGHRGTAATSIMSAAPWHHGAPALYPLPSLEGGHHAHFHQGRVARLCDLLVVTRSSGRSPPRVVSSSLRIVVLGYTNGPPFLKIVSSLGTHQVGVKERPIF